MMTVRSERLGSLPAHLGAPSRRSTIADRSRPSNRASHGTGRPVFLEADPTTRLTTLRGSMFEASAPQRF